MFRLEKYIAILVDDRFYKLNYANINCDVY